MVKGGMGKERMPHTGYTHVYLKTKTSVEKHGVEMQINPSSPCRQSVFIKSERQHERWGEAREK